MRLISKNAVVNLLRPKKNVDIQTWIAANIVDVTDMSPYSFYKTPYFREIAKDIQNGKIESIVVLKSAQVGYSFFLHAVLAFFSANDPANILFILPNKDKCLEENNNRVYPTLREVADLTIVEKRKFQIKFPSSYLWFASGELAKDLKSKTCRYVVGDEIDELSMSVEGEGSPIDMALARTITKRNCKSLWGSTPKNAEGHVSKLYNEATDKRIYHVPCPHCNAYQELIWENLKWNKIEGKSHTELAAEIESNPSNCWYECKECGARLTEADKKGMIHKGLWVSQTQRIEGGQVKGARPIGSKVAYKIHALYSLWFDWSKVAAKWLQAVEDPNARKAFLSQYLGQLPKPRERSVVSGGVSLARQEQQHAQQLGIVRGVVPNFAGLLCIGADVQKDRVYWVLRAFGRVRSQLVDYGVSANLEDVLGVLNRSYASAAGHGFKVDGLAVDFGGYSTKQGEDVEDVNAKRKVFNFADADERIYPIKGLGFKVREDRFLQCNHDAVYNREYLAINSNVMIRNIFELRDDKKWLSNSCVDDGYISSIDSVVPLSDGTFKQGSNNHYFDAECYCQSMSMHLNQSDLPSEEEIERKRGEKKVTQEARLDVSGILPSYAKKWS